MATQAKKQFEEHAANKHAGRSFAECFPGYEEAAAAASEARKTKNKGKGKKKK